MAIAITMKQAFDQALEEITNFHLDPQHDGFPRELTHHINRESPRRLSHGVDFVDHGNWAGSVLMYAMLFEVGPELSLLRILDQTGLRWHVYRYWGAEGQTSGKGPDNDRTNLLESMLSLMGPEKSASTERAWDFVRRYWLRHPKLTRQELLEQALSDPSVNIYTDDDAIAEQIMTGMCTETGDDKDPAKADILKLLFPFVRQRARTPDHYDIRRITGSSPKNIPLLRWLRKHLIFFEFRTWPNNRLASCRQQQNVGESMRHKLRQQSGLTMKRTVNLALLTRTVMLSLHGALKNLTSLLALLTLRTGHRKKDEKQAMQGLIMPNAFDIAKEMRECNSADVEETARKKQRCEKACA
jgi:hypothetical protein